MRSRSHHLFRAKLLYVSAVLGLIFFPVLSFFTENINLVQGIGMGLLFAIFSVIVGTINYNLFLSDVESERAKDSRIRKLEQELKKKESSESKS